MLKKLAAPTSRLELSKIDIQIISKPRTWHTDLKMDRFLHMFFIEYHTLKNHPNDQHCSLNMGELDYLNPQT